jgi:hypothetical protein
MKLITYPDLFYYLQSEAQKVAWEKAKLVKASIEIYKQPKKIDKAFASSDEIILNKLKRITIIIDEYKVIWIFDYNI